MATFNEVRARVGPNFFISTLLKSDGKFQPDKTYVHAATTSQVTEKINLKNLSLTSKPKEYQTLAALKAKAAMTSEQINSERTLMGQTNNLPEDLSTYIRSLAEQSTLQELLDLCELLKMFYENPLAGISIVYEA